MAEKGSFHENFEAHAIVRLPSNRKFGLVMTAFFLLVGLIPLRSHRPVRIWSLTVAGLFLLALLIAPSILLPLNRLWMKLGVLLGHVAGNVTMFALFFLIFTPAGICLRMLGKDPLRLKLIPGDASYWLRREPPGPDPATMRHQF